MNSSTHSHDRPKRSQLKPSFFENIASDLRYAARSLRRTPAFALTVIFTLALGIGVNAAIFNLLNAVILRTLPVPEPEQLRLLSVVSSSKDGERIFSYPVLRQMEAALPSKTMSLAGFALPMPTRTLSPSGETERSTVQIVSGSFFSTLAVKPQIGRVLNEGDDATSGPFPAVLSDAYWASRFGRNPAVLGSTFTTNETPVVVVGIASAGFFGVLPGQAPDFWLPASAQHHIRYTRHVWNSNGDADKSFLLQPQIRWLGAVARVGDPHAEPAMLAAINQVYARDMQREVLGWRDPVIRRELLRSTIRLESGSKGLGDLRSQFAAPLLVLITATGLVLLIACLNIASLALARWAARQKEIAIRLALGASNSRIIVRMLTEALLLSLLAGLISIPVTVVASRLLLRWASNGITMPLDVHLSGPVLAFVALVSLLTGLVFGILPSLRVIKLTVAENLKAQASSLSGMRLPWGRTLIAAQVTFSFVLLMGAGLFVRTLINYAHVPLGFTPDRVVTFQIDTLGAHYSPSQLLPMYKRVLGNLETLPRVQSAAFASCGLAVNCQSVSGINILGRPASPGDDQRMQKNVVTPEYFRTVGMRLLAGRFFTAHDGANGHAVAVINQTAANAYFNNVDPIGQHFGYGSKESGRFEIIGVVADALVNNVHSQPRPMGYQLLDQVPSFVESLDVRTKSDPVALEERIRAAVHATEPNLPITKPTLLTDRVDSNTVRERLVARLATAFALLALALSCLGVYGVLSYAIARRTSELGIRLALGAEKSSLRWMVLKEALGVLAFGLALGLPLALSLAGFIKGLLYGLSPNDPASFAFAGGCLLIAGIAAALVPAWRASRVDPMVALRNE